MVSLHGFSVSSLHSLIGGGTPREKWLWIQTAIF